MDPWIAPIPYYRVWFSVQIAARFLRLLRISFCVDLVNMCISALISNTLSHWLLLPSGEVSLHCLERTYATTQWARIFSCVTNQLEVSHLMWEAILLRDYST